MSSKKDKFLESAQKFIVKGQLDRAIKDYEQVVALDPGDIRHRQRLAELLVRANRTVEAIGEYEAIGRSYADNGFYLKAIAVYKQVQKLEPDDIKTSLTLATLNEKQGLTGNALAEYGRVQSHFERSGKLNDALRVLESMVAIDPENPDSRLKLAETRYALGQKDPAYGDFGQAALLLHRRGDESAFARIADRVRYLFSDRKGFVLELLSAEIESGNASLAVSRLQELTEKDQADLKAWHLLLDAYQATGAVAEAGSALQSMARMFPDDPYTRERLMQRALDDGDVDGCLALLDRDFDLFHSRGKLPVLERIYRGLLVIAPHDTRVLKGLVKLYEAEGDQAKLAEMVERLDTLDHLLPRPAAPGLVACAADLADDDRQGPPVTEEEIPLGLVEDEEAVAADAVRDSGSASVAGLADADAEADGAPETAIEPDYPGEIDLELDLSDDELADMEVLYGEEPADAAAGLAWADDARGAVADMGPALEEGFAALDEMGGSAAGCDTCRPHEIFSGFKKGLDQQLDQGDTETRYNLGIAFKEMGLYDEAMTEFEAAAADPKRRIDCLTLQGICCRDRGDFARAEAIFRDGIALEGLADEEFLSISYELALLYESAGRTEDALAAYRQIEARQHDFRETKGKIARLQGDDDLDELELVELGNEDLV